MNLTKSDANFNKPTERIEFAKLIADLIPHNEQSFIPIQPNSTDSRYFVLDRGNDWRIVFTDNSKTNAVITYRYHCRGVLKEEELAKLITQKYHNVKIITSHSLWKTIER